jgi:hypothetical protein
MQRLVTAFGRRLISTETPTTTVPYVDNMNLTIMFSVANLATSGETAFLAHSTKK